jgi:hypothetical protein
MTGAPAAPALPGCGVSPLRGVTPQAARGAYCLIICMICPASSVAAF